LKFHPPFWCTPAFGLPFDPILLKHVTQRMATHRILYVLLLWPVLA
jgi:hypothetical protein